ncbi:MAG: carbonic anhydrase family protein [Bacteroidales bacterium]|nr:carbonic anhydrase family protein [Bacteroidales bacterium]
MTLNTKFFFLAIFSILLFSACESSDEQLSPIDLNSGISNPDFTPLYNDYYFVNNFNLVNSGSFIEVDINDCYLLIPNKDEFLGQEVALEKILIKSPSEHTVQGVNFPLELQFIHHDTLGNSVNVAVFVEAGNENSFFDAILNNIPAKNQSANVNQEIDIYSLFPQNPDYWHYLGSTTTKPYVDSVKWFVMKEKISLSDAQIKKVVDAIGTNKVDIVELGNRQIIEL